MKVNCKNYSQVEFIAEQNDFHTRELTSGSNGYPENTRKCITGFETYEQAKDFATKTGGEVTSIRSRDGWTLSQSEGWVSGAYDIRNILLKNYESESIEIISNNGNDIDNYLASVKDTLKEYVDNAEDFDDLHGVVANIFKAQDIASKVEDLEDDELLFVLDGEPEVLKKFATHYNHDVWTYDIAVEFGTIADIRTLEDLADYINSCDDYPYNDIALICEREDWPLGDDDEVCRDDYSKLVIMEGAKVINL